MKLPVPRYLIYFILVITSLSGCVYYNTFFNARKAFNEAEKTRKESKYGRPSINQAKYKKAIEKSLKVVENYPNSKWYDDALFVLGVSYYYTKQYNKAEKRFREILANYEDSKYAKESRLYLAKTKLMKDDTEEAMALFQELLDSDIDKSDKAEAAMALGKYYYESEQYDEAIRHFLLIRDSLGTNDQKKIAQRYIADSYFDQFKMKDALGAYLQILGMHPDMNEEYHALFQASVCAFRLQRIDDGIDYLNTLINDERYFDSLNVLRLQLAEGYESDDDLPQAEVIYEQVASESKKRDLAAQAYYNLGLIYQYDYDELQKAKEYYDKAVEQSRSGIGQEALARSADIGKLETYARKIDIDSTTSQDVIDDAAFTQYQLAEVYWFNLNKPDTAIIEMQYVVDSFPTAYDAPKAMVALSEMIREYEEDTLKADSILREMLKRYPHSDYVPEALEALDLLGTEADTGYAELYLRKAEDYLVDEKSIDSARINYQYIVDNFPDSKYYLQARFALIWMTEMYESPGDSSIIYAYNEFADSFPGTEWAAEAVKRTKYRPSRRDEQPQNEVSDTTVIDTMLADVNAGNEGNNTQDTSTYIDPQKAIYTDPDGNTAISIPSKMKVLRIRQEFVYPTEAYADRWEGTIYFQIKLDFSGEVVDLIQKTWSDNDEINIRAEETMRSMVFDMSAVPPELLDSWFVYKFKVVLPDFLR